MSMPLNEGHLKLIEWLAEIVMNDLMENPSGHVTTEAPPFPKELHDPPKPIVRHPDGSISVLIK